MKKYLMIMLVLSTTGCAGLTDYITEELKEMQDTTRYEDIRESVAILCDTKNYDMFIDRFGKATVDKWMKDACSPVTRKVDPGI